jgi:hypothetical protein
MTIEPIYQTLIIGVSAVVIMWTAFWLVVPNLPGDGREAERLAKMAEEDARRHPAE